MNWRLFLVLSSLLICSLLIPAYQKAPSASSTADLVPPVASPSNKWASAKSSTGPVSEAEQIARLKNAIKADEKEMESERAKLEDPQSEYKKAEAEFHDLDEKFEDSTKQIEKLTAAGETQKVEDLRAELETTKRARKLAQERFDLAIQEQKVSKQKIATLEQKLAQERSALDQLVGTPEPAEKPATSPAPAPAPENTPAPATTPTTTPGTAPAATAPAESPKSNPAPAPPTATGLVTGMPGASEPATAPSPNAAASGDAEQPKKPTKEVLKAQAEVQAKTEIAKKVAKDARTIIERMALLDETIAQERSLLATARKKADNANETRAALAAELQEKSVAGAPAQVIQEIVSRLNEAERRFRESREESSKLSQRYEQLQSERSELFAQQNAILREAKAARDQVAEAQSEVARLQNPFAMHNILQWLLDHVPRLIAIIFGMFGVQWLSKVFTRRLVRLMGRKGLRGTAEEREDRARTLVGVFHNAVSVATVGGGLLMVFQEVGIPIAPLMGGAAVVGLAVAFGAQNLIRDYFYGFVILVENQYKLNDVIRIGDTSGQVEQITLRMTVLRDLEGSVHFIPNGEISKVTNMAHGWSRALFNLGVAYKEDADKVMRVVTTLGRELRADPEFGPLILEDLTMLGVDELADSAVVFKFFIKTKPLQQWPVKREMLRRIKRKFDELKIEIPFPQRSLHHHWDGEGDPLEMLPGSEGRLNTAHPGHAGRGFRQRGES